MFKWTRHCGCCDCKGGLSSDWESSDWCGWWLWWWLIISPVTNPGSHRWWRDAPLITKSHSRVRVVAPCAWIADEALSVGVWRDLMPIACRRGTQRWGQAPNWCWQEAVARPVSMMERARSRRPPRVETSWTRWTAPGPRVRSTRIHRQPRGHFERKRCSPKVALNVGGRSYPYLHAVGVAADWSIEGDAAHRSRPIGSGLRRDCGVRGRGGGEEPDRPRGNDLGCLDWM